MAVWQLNNFHIHIPGKPTLLIESGLWGLELYISIMTLLLHGAGSALAQSKTAKVTSSKVASAASKTLRKSGASKSAKAASGSALTQRPNKKRNNSFGIGLC